MNTENTRFNNSSEWKTVKDICAHLPDIRVTVLSQAFVVEAVGLGCLAGFVVTAKHCYAGRVTDFECDKDEECLEGVKATIDVIAHEEIVCLGRVATNKEELTEVVELTVDVSDNGDGRRHHFDGWLFDKYLLGLLTKDLNFAFCGIFALSKLFDELIEIRQPRHYF